MTDGQVRDPRRRGVGFAVAVAAVLGALAVRLASADDDAGSRGGFGSVGDP